MRTRVTRSRSAKKVNQESGFSLPDDLVINILIRLRVEDVLRCRRVCRRWRDLTCTKHFGNTSARFSNPVILLEALDKRDSKSNHILLTKWWKSGPTRSNIRTLNDYSERFSQYAPHCSGDGLLVLKSEHSLREFIVFNPLCGKKVSIVFSPSLFGRIEAFAIYFHPTLKEHCILWAVYWRPGYDPDEKGFQYMVLVLGSNPCWRKIRNPWIHELENPYKPAVLLGRYLYWLVKLIDIENSEHSGKFAIMEFDILDEELKVMVSPVSTQGYNKNLLNNENVSLLNAIGLLSLFLISPKSNYVYEWKLLCREKEMWFSMRYNIRKLGCYSGSSLRAVGREDEHLLVESSRIIVLKLEMGKAGRLGRDYDSCLTFLPHVITLDSLSNCASKIIIEEKDDGISVEPKDEEDVTSWKD